jgi:hypothetical protein
MISGGEEAVVIRRDKCLVGWRVARRWGLDQCELRHGLHCGRFGICPVSRDSSSVEKIDDRTPGRLSPYQLG